jgi:CheY-like chemotaxis protein
MSHELRTPLNSLLILAKLLADNKEGNLSDKQVEYAKTIHSSGGDLLTLINEILDLSKVEAGKMQIEPREVALADVAEFVERNFAPVAEQKGLAFTTALADGAPRSMRTDPQRLQQVLKNLLANAFKFTERGSVRLEVSASRGGARFDAPALRAAERVIGFSVVDTGIGIPKDKQRIIFEAFQQADGTTSRKYGGTGLGLSISREIARLLGGEIHVESEPGAGSTFTLFLPERYSGPEMPPEESDARELPAPKRPPRGALQVQPAAEVAPQTESVADDREHLCEGDRVLLIVEDDVKFARILVGIAREAGFRAVVATRGDTALSLANDLLPAAITLDLQLPVLDGWSILDRLKRNPRTRHIPVHVISVAERKQRAASLGAFAWLEKPVSKEALEGAMAHIAQFVEKRPKRLLVIEDDHAQAQAVRELVGGDDVDVVSVGSGAEALDLLRRGSFDCVVLDLLLGDSDGTSLLEQIKGEPRLHDVPVVVYTGKELTAGEEARLKRLAESVIVKTRASSPERLLADTALFLHRVEKNLSPPDRLVVERTRGRPRALEGRKVLVVDDDVRNIFALTSVLEAVGVRVLYAENGKDAIAKIERNADLDVVLMDVMMPGMDGYETIRRIRHELGLKSLPIVAVTAKALKEDRDKCIAAGASDYLAKPVDNDKLIELLQLWID